MKNKNLIIFVGVIILCMGIATAYTLSGSYSVNVNDAAYTDYINELNSRGLSLDDVVSDMIGQDIENEYKQKLLIEISTEFDRIIDLGDIGVYNDALSCLQSVK